MFINKHISSMELLSEKDHPDFGGQVYAMISDTTNRLKGTIHAN